MPDPGQLWASEVPVDIPLDATFQCKVRLTNQDDGVKRLLGLLKNDPLNTYRSSSAPLNRRALETP